MRLLAFSAQWFDFPAGYMVFSKGDDPADGVFLIQSGEAEFLDTTLDGDLRHVRTLGKGALVGELALIMHRPRTLSMRARTAVRGLRIGGEEFLAVPQNDPTAAIKMLQMITGYLIKAPDLAGTGQAPHSGSH